MSFSSIPPKRTGHVLDHAMAFLQRQSAHFLPVTQTSSQNQIQIIVTESFLGYKCQQLEEKERSLLASRCSLENIRSRLLCKEVTLLTKEAHLLEESLQQQNSFFETYVPKLEDLNADIEEVKREVEEVQACDREIYATLARMKEMCSYSLHRQDLIEQEQPIVKLEEVKEEDVLPSAPHDQVVLDQIQQIANIQEDIATDQRGIAVAQADLKQQFQETKADFKQIETQQEMLRTALAQEEEAVRQVASTHHAFRRNTERMSAQLTQVSTMQSSLMRDFTQIKANQEQVKANQQALLKGSKQIDQDQQALFQDFRQMGVDYRKIAADYSQIVKDYRQITEDYRRLIADYKEDTEDYKQLSVSYKRMTADYRQLSTSYKQITADYKQIGATYKEILESYTQLRADYSRIAADQERIETDQKQIKDEQQQLKVDFEDLETKFQAEAGSLEALAVVADAKAADQRQLKGEMSDLFQRLKDLNKIATEVLDSNRPVDPPADAGEIEVVKPVKVTVEQSNLNFVLLFWMIAWSGNINIRHTLLKLFQNRV